MTQPRVQVVVLRGDSFVSNHPLGSVDAAINHGPPTMVDHRAWCVRPAA
jgi:hypothetical protein